MVNLLHDRTVLVAGMRPDEVSNVGIRLDDFVTS